MNKLVIIALFISCFSFANESPKTVSAEQLLINQMTSEPYLIIDVRTHEEFSAGHLKGAINVPFNEIDQHQSVLSDLVGKRAVVYCRSGRRAGIFIDAMQDKGIELVHLDGDYQGWTKAALPVVKAVGSSQK
ncbi:rhodanese-like domain-containing protein [Pseudoalteromonas xiamenensis]